MNKDRLVTKPTLTEMTNQPWRMQMSQGFAICNKLKAPS